jgi:hypothetical protein
MPVCAHVSGDDVTRTIEQRRPCKEAVSQKCFYFSQLCRCEIIVLQSAKRATPSCLQGLRVRSLDARACCSYRVPMHQSALVTMLDSAAQIWSTLLAIVYQATVLQGRFDKSQQRPSARDNEHIISTKTECRRLHSLPFRAVRILHVRVLATIQGCHCPVVRSIDSHPAPFFDLLHSTNHRLLCGSHPLDEVKSTKQAMRISNRPDPEPPGIVQSVSW